MSAAVTSHFPFPTAVHSYFTLTNRQVEKTRFMNGEVENPTFEYRLQKSRQDIYSYHEQTRDHPEMFRRLDLVRSSLELQTDASQLEAFRKANVMLYRTPRVDYAEAILSHYGSLATSRETQVLWNEIQARLGRTITVRSLSIGPSTDTFLLYRGYLLSYTDLPSVSLSCSEAIQFLLNTTGLTNADWRVRLLSGDEHARTYHKAKTISIGLAYTPHSKSAVKRIATHEVIGHAVRGPQPSLAESEGVAIMLEQLTGKRFKMRRTYRYLAIALGWGTLTSPMTFREVYEILWRLMVLGGRTKESAKNNAYDECCRAFRGGRPDVAGAVFLKDTVYFDATIRIWEVLASNKLSYNEFIDVIEGRRTLLS